VNTVGYVVSVTRHSLLATNSTGVIIIQYLLLTFRESMQTLFLRSLTRNKIKA